MAIGWMTVLQSVPWGEVVSNAPKVAAGARKLWKSAAKKAPANPVRPSTTQQVLSPEAQAMSVLKARVLELETVSIDLHEQMVESSGLIRALAEQNTQLIIRIESLRTRLLWLTGAVAVTAVGGAVWISVLLAF